MLQNDINYIYKDVPYPFKGSREDAKSLIKQMLNEHLEESRSSPFFNAEQDLLALKENLPEGWEICFDESTKVPESTLRIIVYNKYEEACRTSGEDFGSVKLKASNLYGNIWVISDIEVKDNNFDELPLTLQSAQGESPVGIVMYGGHHGEFFGEYDDTLDISFSVEDGMSIPECTLEKLVDEFLPKIPKKITTNIAEKFINDPISVKLWEFTILEDAKVAEILAKYDGDLWLIGLETLSDDAAFALSKRNGGIYLSLKLDDTPGHLALKRSIPASNEDEDEPA